MGFIVSACSRFVVDESGIAGTPAMTETHNNELK
jgi:hypothetical protein